MGAIGILGWTVLSCAGLILYYSWEYWYIDEDYFVQLFNLLITAKQVSIENLLPCVTLPCEQVNSFYHLWMANFLVILFVLLH